MIYNFKHFQLYKVEEVNIDTDNPKSIWIEDDLTQNQNQSNPTDSTMIWYEIYPIQKLNQMTHLSDMSWT